MSVNLLTGKWARFAGEEAGGDLVSLYAYLQSISQAEAAAELCPDDEPMRHINGHAPPQAHPTAADEAELSAPQAAPADSALPAPSGMVGRWLYFLPPARGPVLIVCRLLADGGGKTFRQFTWRTGRMGGRANGDIDTRPRWVAKGYGDNRPLYRLPELIAAPAARVLVVEGEKAADAAQAALGPAWVVITWSGGAQAERKSDWTPLRRRDVVIWPDADEAGRGAGARIAGLLLGMDSRVAVIPTDGRPDGWDAGDADPAEIPAILASATPIQRPERLGRANPAAAAGAVVEPSGRVLNDGSAYSQWQGLELDCSSNGVPYPNDANVATIFRDHTEFKGRIWFDEFREEIWHAWGTDTPRQWVEGDETAALIWMQQQLKLPKLGVFSVRRAVAHVARIQRRNELTEWLESLQWDRTERLEHWLSDFLGCINDDRHQRYGKIWLLTMVARAFRPGVKVDTVPVLEGPMGRGKSAIIKILGGQYATALDEQFGSKDFLQCLRGKWLVEIPDLAGFRGRDHTAIISAISRDTDNYRASYAQYATDHPRRCIFTITTELTADYLQEDRGMRRFLPISCGRELFDFDGLKRSREQLFAEAVHRFKAGEPWWLPMDQDAEVQRSRVSQHPWTDRVMNWVEGSSEITSAEILTQALEIPVKDQTDGQKTIVGRILTAGGWVQLATTRKGERLRLWRKQV